MGIITKQTVSGSFFSYAGVILGFINLAVLSPIVFSTDQIGLPALLIAISVIVAQLGSLGFNGVTVRLFPWFRDKEKKHNGFLGLSVIVQSAGLIIAIILMLFLIPGMIERNSDDISILKDFVYLVIPLIIFHQSFVLFDSYARVLYNASIGIVLKEFVIRIINLILILLFHFEVITFQWFMYLYVLSYGIPTLVLIIYLIIRKEFTLRLKLGFISRDMRSEIITVSVFGIIAGLSGLAVSNIDKYMINEYLSLSSVGIYTIAFSFGSLILVPGRAMSRIAGPLIAQYWKDGDTNLIRSVYQKSSISQFIGGIVILLMIWSNIKDLFVLLPDKYSDGTMVIIYISLANLFTVTSGVSPQILNTSKHYRFHSYFMVVQIALIIITNIIFIPIMGITGAAFASFLATAAYSLIRVLFIQVKYKMQPLGIPHIKALIPGIIILAGTILIPLDFHPIINIGIRVVVTGGFYILSIYALNCSEDVNEEIRKYLGMIGQVFRS